MRDLAEKAAHAVRMFWSTRRRQALYQGSRSGRDRGARSAVTGGKQMDGFIHLVHAALTGIGVPDDAIRARSRLELPGWYRAEKKWDLVVVLDDNLIAAVEFKSQVGPSFGNNFNNRSEEAIGSATDLWAAYREGAFKPSIRPWVGYVMLLEDCEASRTPVSVATPNFPVFPEYVGASYARRYELMVEKLIRDRLYDGAAFLLSDQRRGRAGYFAQPHSELTLERLVTQLFGHAAAVLAT